MPPLPREDLAEDDAAQEEAGVVVATASERGVLVVLPAVDVLTGHRLRLRRELLGELRGREGLHRVRRA